MFVWNLEEGVKVEQMPAGRKGTVVDWEGTTLSLSCGCCSMPGPDVVELTWDDTGERDFVDSDELRKVD